MTAPTRERKQERIYMYCDVWKMERGDEADDIDKAILSDYAPLSDERRAELEWQRSVVQHTLQYCIDCLRRNDEAVVAGNPFFDQADSLKDCIEKYEAWLAELDAELEGDK